MPAPETTSSCPTCGAPITREDLSLCSYCGAPLKLGGALKTAEGEESPNTERLTRMEEKEEWAAAMDWEPLSTSRHPVYQIVSIPLISGILMALLIGFMSNGWAGLVVGTIVLIALKNALIVFGHHPRKDPLTPLNPDAPLQKRASIVLDRRSETEIVGGEGCTTYYFILEFTDAARGEFRFPGRGPTFDLMVNGATGVAYTRGADLLAFKKIRV